MPERCAKAIRDAVGCFQRLGVEDWAANAEAIDRARSAVARLINAGEDEIALTRCTTDGINWVANGLGLRSGDRVVSINGEYPANIYPWMRLRKHGVEFHLIEPVERRVTLDQIADALTANTRVLAISWVQFASGFRIDLEAVGRLCEERGVLLVVDVIQGLGAFPLDVKQCRVSFLSCGAQKWMLGPQGAAFFYCPKENLDRVELTQVGSDSVANPLPYLEYDYTPRPGARAALNTARCRRCR